MLRKLSLALMSLVFSIAALEAYLHPKPLKRVQRVLMFQDRNNVEIVDGVALWSTKNLGLEVVANRSCLQEVVDRPDVLLAGDSIFYGVTLEPSQTLAPLLQQQLTTQLERPSCVVNLSQPGYSFQNENVAIRRAVDEFHPRVVVLEVWANSVHKFALTHESAYNFGSIEVDELGFPNLGLPPSLNQQLFSRSAIWRQMSTGLVPVRNSVNQTQWEDFVTKGLEPLRLWLAEKDVALVLAFATAMSAPLSEERPKESSFSKSMEWAKQHDIPQIYFLDVMASEKVEEMSIDKCCHLSEKGTQMVADALDPILVDLLTEDKP
jgi:hypothetical protein